MSVTLRKKQLKGGKVSYYLDIYFNKRRFYEFLNIKVNQKSIANEKQLLDLAKEIRAKREHELLTQANGLINKQGKKIQFIGFYEKFIETKNTSGLYSGVLKHLKAFSGTQFLSIGAINTTWIKDFQEYLLKRVSHNSAAMYVDSISCSLKEAKRKKIIDENPFDFMAASDKLRKKETYRSFHSLEVIEKLASIQHDSIHSQIRLAFLLSCFTGLRWSDIHCLKWEEVKVNSFPDHKEYFLYFEQEKTEKISTIPLLESAIQLIEERKKQAQKEFSSPFVFPYLVESGNNSKKKYQLVRRVLRKWAQVAGINPKSLHFHSGRHSFATNIYENCPDVDVLVLKELLGHKDIHSTMIYTHLTTKKMRNALSSFKFRLNDSGAA